MKTLTLTQARNCEQAKEPVCKCRCAGRLHGARRGGAAPDRAFFEGLQENDPHALLDAARQEVIRKERLEAKRRARAELMERRWTALASVGGWSDDGTG
jgi:hypothetical protein